jgi:hypothetical protein
MPLSKWKQRVSAMAASFHSSNQPNGRLGKVWQSGNRAVASENAMTTMTSCA